MSKCELTAEDAGGPLYLFPFPLPAISLGRPSGAIINVQAKLSLSSTIHLSSSFNIFRQTQHPGTSLRQTYDHKPTRMMSWGSLLLLASAISLGTALPTEKTSTATSGRQWEIICRGCITMDLGNQECQAGTGGRINAAFVSPKFTLPCATQVDRYVGSTSFLFA
jgi:hypothetical protein